MLGPRSRRFGRTRADLQARLIVTPGCRIVPAFESARAAYTSGRGEFSAVVEDFNRWLDAREQLAKHEAERYTLAARLEALTAPPPISLPETTGGAR